MNGDTLTANSAHSRTAAAFASTRQQADMSRPLHVFLLHGGKKFSSPILYSAPPEKRIRRVQTAGKPMRLVFVTAATGVVMVVVIFELLRRRQLREKYGALWLVVALAVLPLAFFPTLLDGFTSVLGIASGLSLFLFLSVVFLLLVAVHLSWESSRLEEETRCLSEEIALLRAEVTELRESREEVKTP
jgi:hypothetical protein